MNAGGGVILRNKDKALRKVSDELPAINTSQLELNWNNAINTPPANVTPQPLSDGRASAFWEFDCHGQRGHVSYNTGTSMSRM